MTYAKNASLAPGAKPNRGKRLKFLLKTKPSGSWEFTPQPSTHGQLIISARMLYNKKAASCTILKVLLMTNKTTLQKK